MKKSKEWLVGTIEGHVSGPIGAAIIGLPGLSYTVGLWKRFQHPELAMLSLPNPQALHVLNGFVTAVREEGKRYSDGETVMFAHEYPGQMVAVPPEYLHALRAIRAYYGKLVPAFQVLWSDKERRLPGDPQCDPKIASSQTWARWSTTN